MACTSAPSGPPAAPDAARPELATLLDRLTGALEGTAETAIAGLALHRIARPLGPQHHIQTPALALIAQGAKRLLVGEDIYTYDPLHYMVTSVDLPVIAQVRTASADAPYLGLRLRLDVEELGQLIRDAGLPPLAAADASRGLYVNRIAAPVLDAVLRLLRLLDTPQDIPILAPLIRREILYRLLVSGEGARLRQIALQDSHAHRIARAIRLLRDNYARPLRVEAVARDVHMSVSSFHHHFKAVTAMSPLQYQKQLRLQEARRLILAGDADAATVAYQVGYESPSQFTREYGRLFGAPPLRDKRRWQADGLLQAAGDAPGLAG
jgi:AraC-like DNA-binding protein